MKVVGMISGTSHDAIEMVGASIVRTGPEVRIEVLGHRGVSYSPETRALIVACLPPHPATLHDVCRLDTAIGQEFGAAARAFINDVLDGDCDLVVSAGQTMYHWVEGTTPRGTLQLGETSWIAAATGRPTYGSVRTSDVASGGHGAPIVSLLDVLLTRDTSTVTAYVNLGGISNVTLVGGGNDPVAYDVGPANALIDEAVRKATDGEQMYDHGGRIAASGSVDEALLDELLTEDYYALPVPKSTGKELFHKEYLSGYGRAATLSLPDLLATLVELTAVTVADSVRGAARVYLAGGGSKNPFMVERLRARLGQVPLGTIDELGVEVDAKEACTVALMGFLSHEGLPGFIPSCTGARAAAVSGGLFEPPVADGARMLLETRVTMT